MKPVALVKVGPVSPYANTIAELFYTSIEDAPDRAHAHFTLLVVDTILKANFEFNGIPITNQRGTIFMRMETQQLEKLNVTRSHVSRNELKEMSAAHAWLLPDVPSQPDSVLLCCTHPNDSLRLLAAECPKDRPGILVSQMFHLLFSSRQNVDATMQSIEATDNLMKKLRLRTQS